MGKPEPIVVIKLGGSLLSLQDLGVRLESIVNQLRNARPLIICGGGEAADIVRRWQPLHTLDDEDAHWLALHAVSLNERLLVSLLPRAVIADTRDALSEALRLNRVPILAAESFVRTEEQLAPTSLPHDWTVTSDSIAAWVAGRLGADRLVLCKSCVLNPAISLQQAVRDSLVDISFPRYAQGLALTWVCLRAANPSFIAWTPATEDLCQDIS